MALRLGTMRSWPAGPVSSWHAAGAGAGGAPQGPVELPFPELRNLAELAAALGGVSMWQKERAARQFLQPGFLDKLLEIFHVRA